MISAPRASRSISERLRTITGELREIQELLISQETVDPRILTDFRDAVNRVRNTAWAVEQYANSKTTETDPKSVLSVVAGERVRAAYQLCRLIQADLSNPEVKFSKGQLLEFKHVTNDLEQRLGDAVGE